MMTKTIVEVVGVIVGRVLAVFLAGSKTSGSWKFVCCCSGHEKNNSQMNQTVFAVNNNKNNS